MGVTSSTRSTSGLQDDLGPAQRHQPTDNARVAGCAISATRNYLKLHMPRTLNPLLSNLHAKTRKLRKHSAMRVAAFRPHAVYWLANHPLMHSACPPRCPPRSSPTSPRADGMPSIEGGADMQYSFICNTHSAC